MRASLSRSVALRVGGGRILRLAPPSDREDGAPRGLPSRPTPAQRKDLPYKVEMWDRGGAALQQVLARALDVQLARAIFHAARKEYPDARILLRRGARTIANSAD